MSYNGHYTAKFFVTAVMQGFGAIICECAVSYKESRFAGKFNAVGGRMAEEMSGGKEEKSFRCRMSEKLLKKLLCKYFL